MKVTFEHGDCFSVYRDRDEIESFGVFLSRQLPDGRQAFVLVSRKKNPEEENRVTFLIEIPQKNFNREGAFFPIRKELG